LPTPFHELLARVLADMLVEEVRSGKIRAPESVR
jgi:hypothetical protein